jgi:hypothetical protein
MELVLFLQRLNVYKANVNVLSGLGRGLAGLDLALLVLVMTGVEWEIGARLLQQRKLAVQPGALVILLMCASAPGESRVAKIPAPSLRASG